MTVCFTRFWCVPPKQALGVDRLPQSCVGAGDLGAPLPRVRRIGKHDLVGGDSTYDRRTQCGCGGRASGTLHVALLVHGLATLWLNGNLPHQLGNDPEEITRLVARYLNIPASPGTPP